MSKYIACQTTTLEHHCLGHLHYGFLEGAHITTVMPQLQLFFIVLQLRHLMETNKGENTQYFPIDKCAELQ